MRTMRAAAAAAFLLFAATAASAQTGGTVQQPPPASGQPAQSATPSGTPPSDAGTKTGQAGDRDGKSDTTPAKASGEALMKLFVMAVLLESALALLFNWRPFVAYFDGRGVKSLVSFAVALILVGVFRQLDVFTQLLNAYSGNPTPPYEPQALTIVLTAMILAGGSAAVNNVMKSLGIRSPVTAEDITPKPSQTKAWISVALRRRQARGLVYVKLQQGKGAFSTAGTIWGSAKGQSPLRYFLRDFGRYPNSGGVEIVPGQDYTVRLEGVDRNGTTIASNDFGPFTALAGALVDIELKL